MFDSDITILSANVNGLKSHWVKIKNMIRTRKPDIFCLQETHKIDKIMIDKWASRNNYKIFYNCLDKNEKWIDKQDKKKLYFAGTAIFLKYNDVFRNYTILHEILVSHRAQILKFENDKHVESINIINIYAQSDVGKSQTDFYKKMSNDIDSNNKNTVICGDFNMILDPIDCKNTHKFILTAAAKVWRDFTIRSESIDIFRYKYPKKKIYTVYKKHQSRRIDRIYISKNLEYFVKDTRYEINYFSDHLFQQKLVLIQNKKLKWGSGIWRNNVSHFKELRLEELISELFYRAKNEKVEFDSIHSWWDYVKSKIRNLLQFYDREMAKKRKTDLDSLNRLLLTDINEGDVYEEAVQNINKIKNTHKDFEIVTLHRNDIEYGEKHTSFFFNMLKQRKSKKNIREVVWLDKKLTERNDIMNSVHDFYSNLWGISSMEDGNEQDQFLEIYDDLPMPIDDESDEDSNTEDYITIDEIKWAISDMENNKAPGPDGIAKEFYAQYWDIVKVELVEIFNNSLFFGTLCKTWKEVIVKLIYKKGDSNVLGNWRPISLTNVDYKIFMKILARRLKSKFENLILNSQKCGLPNRNIADLLRNINAAYEYSLGKKLPLLILSLDQEKAFDMVSHSFLFKILHIFRIKANYIQIIRNLYTEAKARIMINGKLSKEVELKRGLKQGCPLSMLLYAVIADPLARKIECDPIIKPIKIGNIYVKTQQYADDMNILTTDTPSIRRTFMILDKFKRATGQKINKEKSKILCCSDKLWDVLRKSEFKNMVERQIKILGQKFGQNMVQKTWEEKIGKIKKLLHLHRDRNLTWIGKTLFLESVVVNLFLYNARIINVPKNIINNLNSILFKFLWYPEKIEHTSRKVLIKEIVDGGIGFPHINCKYLAGHLEKLSILAKLDSPKEVWHCYELYLLGTKVRQINRKIYSNNILHSDSLNKYWEEILTWKKTLNWKEDKWKEANFNMIYKTVKKSFEKKKILYYETNDNPIKWTRVLHKAKDQKFLCTNQEIINDYRIARNGYLFGYDKKERNIISNKFGFTEILKCKACRSDHDTAEHILLDCPLARYIIEKLKIKINRDEIFFNFRKKDSKSYKQIILSVYKNIIIKFKMQSDIENKYICNIDNVRKGLFNKIRAELLLRRKILENIENIDENLKKNFNAYIEKLRKIETP